MKTIQRFTWLIFVVIPIVQPADPSSPVCIIGAGLTGLTCASTLIANNFQNVKIYERSNRIGGRINPIQMPNGDGDTEINVGAEFVAKGTPFYNFVQQQGLIPNPTPVGRTEYSTGKGCKLPTNITDQLDNFATALQQAVVNAAASAPVGSSVGSLYQTALQTNSLYATASPALQSYLLAMFRLIEKSNAYENGGLDWTKMAPKQAMIPANVMPYEGNGQQLTKNGMQDLLDYFTDQINTDPMTPNIMMNAPVTQISYQTGKQPSITVNGQNVQCSFVVDTRSLGVLKTGLSIYKVSSKLPQAFIDSVTNTGFGLFDKFAFVYQTPWWSQNLAQQLFVNAGPSDPWTCSFQQAPMNQIAQSLWTVYTNPNIPNVLMGIVSGGTDPAYFELAPDSVIIQNMTDTFKVFFKNNNIPPPTQLIRWNWGSDPNIMGSTSFYSTQCAALSTCTQTSLALNLQYTSSNQKYGIYYYGEATDAKAPGTLNGAYQAGLDCASKIQNL